MKDFLSSPFPGMDPYLETPDLWVDVHHGLISQLRATLNLSLRPHYVARLAFRVYVREGINAGVQEARVEIRHVATGALVTVMEVVSPANKVCDTRGRA